MRKRIITPRTLIWTVAATAILTAWLIGVRQPANAAAVLQSGRYQAYPASEFGEPNGIVIFDSENGVLRKWVDDSVTTYAFSDYRQVPEKRTYR
jgi:hypothetical protein